MSKIPEIQIGQSVKAQDRLRVPDTEVRLGGRESVGFEPITRPARALIGWIDPRRVDSLFAGPDLPAYQQAAARARAAVRARAPSVEQADVLGPLPKDAREYVTEWMAGNLNAADGSWRGEMADLRQVFAAQPFIFTDHVHERVSDLDENDAVSLASFTLSGRQSVPVSGQYDFTKNAYVFASPNPNLHVLGNWNGQAEGHAIFGFAVGLVTSFMNVAVYQGRAFLCDGYHRALGLLRRGVYRVPVMVRDCIGFEDMGFPQGMLPQDVYLGDRPPRLPDYLNDDVAVSVNRTATQKVIVIQASRRRNFPNPPCFVNIAKYLSVSARMKFSTVTGTDWPVAEGGGDCA
jgi:hypothetical protein